MNDSCPDPLLTMEQVAAYLHMGSASGALRWVKQHDVRRVMRGRTWLVRRSVIDAELERSAVGGIYERAKAFGRGAR